MIPERSLVATVTENRYPFDRETVLLFATLRHFGGSLSRARAIAYFVNAANADTVEQLHELGVEVRTCQPVNPAVPHASKISALHDDTEIDYLVVLDSDTCILRDFSIYLAGHAIGIKPVDCERLTMAEWEHLFTFFGLEVPSTRYLTTVDRVETIAYFNSGVLIVPRRHIVSLRESWRTFTQRIIDSHPTLPEAARYSHSDQFALAIALAAERIPVRALPHEMNFPTHLPVHPDWRPESLEPFIIHYHHRLAPDGGLLPSLYDHVNREIDRINEISGAHVSSLPPMPGRNTTLPSPIAGLERTCRRGGSFAARIVKASRRKLFI